MVRMLRNLQSVRNLLHGDVIIEVGFKVHLSPCVLFYGDVLIAVTRE